MLDHDPRPPDQDTGGGFAARKALEWTLELCERLGFDPEPLIAAEAAAKPEVAA